MDAKFLSALAKNERTPSDVLDQAHAQHVHDTAGRGDATVLAHLARHPNASKELIGKLIKHPNDLVAQSAAEHTHAKHFYNEMPDHLKMYSKATRHAPPEIHAAMKLKAREAFGPTLHAHGYKEVPEDMMPPRSHPGRLTYVHDRDPQMIHIGVMKMGQPYTEKHPWGYRQGYTQAVPVMGWKRFSAKSMSSPRGTTADSLDKHLHRVKKNFPTVAHHNAVAGGTLAHRGSYGSDGVEFARKVQNFRAVAKPPVLAPKHDPQIKGYTDAGIGYEDVLVRAARLLEQHDWVGASMTHPEMNDETSPLGKRASELYDKHMPPSGPAAHLEGELHRAATRIYYDYHNNGFGNNWSGAHNLLRKHQEMLSDHEPHVKDALDHLVSWKNSKVHRNDHNMFNRGHKTKEAVETIVRASTKALDHADSGGEFGAHPGDMFSHHNRGCKCGECARNKEVVAQTGHTIAQISHTLKGKTEDVLDRAAALLENDDFTLDAARHVGALIRHKSPFRPNADHVPQDVVDKLKAAHPKMFRPDTREHFARLCSRKEDWDQMRSHDYSKLSKEQQGHLHTLPVVDLPAHHSAWDDHEEFPKDPIEKLVRRGGQHYYVNSEGYSYARYGFHIQNFPGVKK